MTSQKRHKASNLTDQIASKDSSAAFEVTLSEAAESAYDGFYKRAADARNRGEATSYHYTSLNMIDEVLEHIIPRDPFNKQYALQGNLSGIFRMKKGRFRIGWIGNSTLRQVTVIFISENLRKEGDSKDPYRLLTAMLLSGECDEVFVGLGLPPPSKFSRGNNRITLQ